MPRPEAGNSGGLGSIGWPSGLGRYLPVYRLSPNATAVYSVVSPWETATNMKCPYCLSDNDRVLDSRASQDGFAIRRRRECLDCKRRYTTYERIEATTVKIVKKDGSREAFDHLKIKQGLEKACWKRPISDEQIEAIIAAVASELETNFDSEVESRHLGELVMQRLREVDEVAYVRFASVYRQFKDVQDFVEELRPCWPRPDGWNSVEMTSEPRKISFAADSGARCGLPADFRFLLGAFAGRGVDGRP